MIQCHDFKCGNHGVAGEYLDESKHCRKCYGAARNAALAKSLGRDVLFEPPPPPAPIVPSRPTPPPLGPCRHKSELPLLNGHAARLGLDPNKLWHECAHPARPLGPYVCGCKGCGPGCRGYAQSPAIEWPMTRGTQSFAPVAKRHLIYHLLPVKGHVWRSGVDQLRARWNLFDGRKLVAIATGPVFTWDGTGLTRRYELESAAAVRAYLPRDAEVIEVPNDPKVREVATWSRQWSRALSAAGDNDAILYAHAKGVCRPLGTPAHRWADMLYTLSLDHWPRVAELLARFPIAGSLRRRNYSSGPSVIPWHYAGTFFWVRAGDMRLRPWQEVTADSWLEKIAPGWSNEAWPGTAYHVDESGLIFGELPGDRRGDPYQPGTWPAIEQEYAKWIASNPPSPVSGSSLPARDLTTSAASPTA